LKQLQLSKVPLFTKRFQVSPAASQLSISPPKRHATSHISPQKQKNPPLRLNHVTIAIRKEQPIRCFCFAIHKLLNGALSHPCTDNTTSCSHTLSLPQRRRTQAETQIVKMIFPVLKTQIPVNLQVLQAIAAEIRPSGNSFCLLLDLFPKL
jgi:hypothetical protein